ncbi:MAG: pilus assembly protein [Gammaproteobacteria bacterium HGW-Gammaproteobacteria-4]|jgi:type IV fimbrial biogenesis protein FimT|nr:MAG: pilus assembly protein [Gammaproteobacteria bacterium HGW-Gammaproteobacteria-4]
MHTRKHGFSLIELMTTLAIAAILIPLSVPGWQRFQENHRASALSNQVLASIFNVRSNAIVSGGNAVLCPSPDGEQCSRDLDWSVGLLSFQDRNRNGQREAGETIIAVIQAGDMRGIRLLTSKGRPRIAYRSDGRSTGTNLSLRLCSNDDRLLRKIIVSVGGRPRVEAAKPDASCSD